MSLRHGLLGLLAEGPASGYDLSRRFQEMLGTIYPAQHPKIYAELGRLSAAGLIAEESEGPRRRKAYRITEAGLDEVRAWLAAGEVDHTVRLQPLLRSVFFWLMEPDDLRRHLIEEQRFYTEQAARCEAYAAAKHSGDGPRTQSLRVTSEAAVRLYRALADWAEWARSVPPVRDH